MSSEKAVIQPGTNIDCAVKIDEDNNAVDVRKATVYDIDEKEMIISQTTPPVLRSYVGQRIAVTHVTADTRVRLGRSGRIERIMKDYQLSSSRKVTAIVLTELSGEKQFNLRFAYRVRPPEKAQVRLFNSQQEQLEIIDVSALGVKFAHDLSRSYKLEQHLKLYLGFERAYYELNGLVVRKDDGVGVQLKRFEHVAVQFIGLDNRTEEELRKMVRKIERLIVSSRLFD